MGNRGSEPRGVAGATPGVPERERILAEHRAIAALLVDLGETQDLAQTVEILDKLLQILPGHFVREERAGGLFEELLLAQPAVDSQIKSLSKEHRRIEKAVAALRTQVGSVTGALARLEEAKAALAETLGTHERTENRLILEIYLTDEGGSG